MIRWWGMIWVTIKSNHLIPQIGNYKRPKCHGNYYFRQIILTGTLSMLKNQKIFLKLFIYLYRKDKLILSKIYKISNTLSTTKVFLKRCWQTFAKETWPKWLFFYFLMNELKSIKDVNLDSNNISYEVSRNILPSALNTGLSSREYIDVSEN